MTEPNASASCGAQTEYVATTMSATTGKSQSHVALPLNVTFPAPTTLAYLGPAGSFTHQAARNAQSLLQSQYGIEITELIAVDNARDVMDCVEQGKSWGIFAWDNNIEGAVVPNWDMLVDAKQAAGVARVGITISFDAFVTPSSLSVPSSLFSFSATDSERANSAVLQSFDGATVTAHPHGLAQCRNFIERYRLQPQPAQSNARACRDLREGEIALGPSICGQLYGLTTVATGVQDFDGASTEFLVLAPRSQAQQLYVNHVQRNQQTEYESIICFIPLNTGAGVLASLLDVLRDAGLNMTNFMSRPIKGHSGTYSFIATIDAAPWQTSLKSVLQEVLDHGDWVKTLAVYPRSERPNPPVDTWMLPNAGVRCEFSEDSSAHLQQQTQTALLWGK